MAYKKRTTPEGRPLWMPVRVADWAADTVHLSSAEFGSLERLNMSYWRSGPPRDDDESLARICGCTIGDWRKARPAIEPFFQIGSGQWTCQRLDGELEEAYRLIGENKKRTESATAAAAAKRISVRNGQRDELRNGYRDGLPNNNAFEQIEVAQNLGRSRNNAGSRSFSSVTDDLTDSVTDTVAINQLQVNSNPALAKEVNVFSSSADDDLECAVVAVEARFGEAHHV